MKLITKHLSSGFAKFSALEINYAGGVSEATFKDCYLDKVCLISFYFPGVESHQFVGYVKNERLHLGIILAVDKEGLAKEIKLLKSYELAAFPFLAQIKARATKGHLELVLCFDDNSCSVNDVEGQLFIEY